MFLVAGVAVGEYAQVAPHDSLFPVLCKALLYYTVDLL